jgi:hypothetical protein
MKKQEIIENNEYEECKTTLRRVETSITIFYRRTEA